MTTKAAASNVVSLDRHRTWRSAQRRSEDLLAAMRRHPSYQGALLDYRDKRPDAVVLKFSAR